MGTAKKILVVDDSSTMRSQLQQVLARAGYAVVEAIDGLDGLERLEAEPDFALILCDVNMPRMSGLELLQRLKQDPRWNDLPVVMLTTEAQPSLLESARKTGARAWIVKPVKPEMLVAAVRRVVGP